MQSTTGALKILPAKWPEGMEDPGSKTAKPARANQLKVLNYRRCFNDHPGVDWVLIIDVDEYIWSPKYATLPELLASPDMPADLTHVRINMMRFGTSWTTERPGYTLVAEDGDVGLLNTENRRFTIDVNVRRGPDERIREPADVIRDSIKACATANLMSTCERCHQSCAHKSIVKASALLPNNISIHDHGIKYGRIDSLDIDLVRGFHYALQSRSHIVKKYGVYHGRPEMIEDYYQIDEFYNAVEDRSLQNRFSHILKERLSPFFMDEVF
jgi:hypothetical protein